MRKFRCDACPSRAHTIACDLAGASLAEFGTLGASAIYRPRQVVFAEGSPAAGLHVVCHGQVKLFCSDRFGHEHVLSLVGPGAVLGELAVEGEPVHAVSAEATVESQLCLVPRERLIVLLQKQPMVAMRLVAVLSRELARTRRQVRDLALKGAESRLAGWILELAAAGSNDAANGNGGLGRGHRIDVPFSRRDIAEMIGVSTETAIRLLARLRDRGAIDIEPHALVIVDPERLARVARHDEIEA